MSIFNSQAFLSNISGSTQQVGSLTLAAEESILFWDTQSKTVSSSVWSAFNEVRNNHDTHTFPLIRDGHLVVNQDGLLLNWEQSLAVLATMYSQYEASDSIAQLLSSGPVQRVTLDENKDSRGNVLFVEEKRVGADLEVVTHNFSDKTTWYTKSERVTGEALTSTSDNLTYNLQHAFVIDLQHGKVHNEDDIVERHLVQGLHGYRPVVVVDGQTLVEYTPFEPSQASCDYEVDYQAGAITFFESQDGATTLTIDYSYATTSEWSLIPDQGTRIDIEKSEVQFSLDTVYTDAIDFEIWGYDPQNPPNKILYKKTSYKSLHGFIDEASGSYPVIPVCGGPAPLGKTQQTLGFPFNYNTVRALSSAQGLELVIRTRNDRPFGGERSTATFYCTVHADS